MSRSSCPSRLQALRRRADGFTLIELLVVIMIMGILAAIAVPIFANARKRSLAENGGGGADPVTTTVTSTDTGGSFPWNIVIAVLGLLVVGTWLFVMAQVNKAKEAQAAGGTEMVDEASETSEVDDLKVEFQKNITDGSATGPVTEPKTLL